MASSSAVPARRIVTPWIVGGVAVLVVAVAGYLLLVRKHTVPEGTVPTEVPVHVARVVRVTLRRYVEGFGSVMPQPAQGALAAASARVASPTTGVVARTLCAEGQRVKKDDVLFELDARAATADVQKAVAAKNVEDTKIARALADAEFSKAEAARTRKLFADGVASDKDVQTAELAMTTTARQVLEARAVAADSAKALAAARARLSLLTIRAPLDGTVVHLAVNAGEAVDLTTILAEIVDLDRLMVEAQLPAVELPSLHLDQPVDLFAAARQQSPGDAGAFADGSPKPGKVSFIGFAVDGKTDTVTVRITFGNEAELRPGQHLRVRIAVEEHTARLAVPSKSVVTLGGVTTISIVRGDRAVQSPVTVGLAEGGLTEVTGEGLTEGMTVVADGAYGLPAETRIHIVEGP